MFNSQNFRQYLRKIKSSLITKYYQFRINTPDNTYRIRWRKEPYQIILILSHMRSGSSLLTHILNSNPEIIGYGETHTQYTSAADWKILMFKVYSQAQDVNMGHRYILDKLLHNHKLLNQELLLSPQIKTIFLLREPQRTLNSILDIKPHWTQEKAFDYYQERLAMLEDYAKLINDPKRSLLLTYDQLLNQTDLVFQTLQDFLATDHSFSEQYQILKTTGMRGIGDSSDQIKSGRILRKPREIQQQIDNSLITKAIPQFEHCLATLSQCCQSISYQEKSQESTH